MSAQTYASRLPAASGRLWAMIESHLVEGNQNLDSGEPLAYGKSIYRRRIGGRYAYAASPAGECGKSAPRLGFTASLKK
ncbi:hypothetical protein ACLK2E_04230 [Escherichia coli]